MPPSSSPPPVAAQARFWDEYWPGQAQRDLPRWTHRRHEAMLAYLAGLPLDRPRIVDLGCGLGWFTEILARFGETTGVDLSAEAIALARARASHVTFIAGDLYQLELPRHRFDVAVSQEVIGHVHDQPGYVRRAAQALRPGGYLILATPNRFVLDRLGDSGGPLFPPEHIDNHLDRRGLKRLLRPHFRILRMTTIIPMGTRGILRWVNSYTVNRWLSWLCSDRRRTAIKEWAGFGYQIVVLAQRRVLDDGGRSA